MPYVLKSSREIELMRQTGIVGRRILNLMRDAAVPGVTTLALDELARDELQRAGAESMSLHYTLSGYKPGQGYPGYTCISVNEEVVHGIPGKKQLKEGDVVTLDLALKMNGYCCDNAITVGIGQISPRLQKLLDVTERTLYLAIEHIKPGKRWSDIARLMQHYVESNGFSVVREFVGHGVGRSMHEEPKIPNFVSPEQLRGDFTLRPGMTLAIEPMVVMGERECTMLADGWTIVTVDRKPAAHFEHTVAVTEEGPDILSDGRVPENSGVATT